jgi:hypothetical protein
VDSGVRGTQPASRTDCCQPHGGRSGYPCRSRRRRASSPRCMKQGDSWLTSSRMPEATARAWGAQVRAVSPTLRASAITSARSPSVHASNAVGHVTHRNALQSWPGNCRWAGSVNWRILAWSWRNRRGSRSGCAPRSCKVLSAAEPMTSVGIHRRSPAGPGAKPCSARLQAPPGPTGGEEPPQRRCPACGVFLHNRHRKQTAVHTPQSGTSAYFLAPAQSACTMAGGVSALPPKIM